MSARQRERMVMSFESNSDAKARHDQQLSVEDSKRSPAGNFLKIEWNKEGMKIEVNGYEDGKIINWSELARRYEIKNKDGKLAKKGGQIAKEWLKSEGILGGLKNENKKIMMGLRASEKR